MGLKFIDVIIPFADSIDELMVTINSLKSQNNFINKVFIVASGPNKKKKYNELKNNLEPHQYGLDIQFILDVNLQTTPGTARNIAIKESLHTSSNFIGFIDCGMVVSENWITSFYKVMNINFIRIGCTKYKATRGAQLISALLSYGTRVSKNSVPGTIIRKDKCIEFPILERWGEDIIWMNNYKNHFNKISNHLCIYSYFQNSILDTYFKYINQIKNVLQQKSPYKRNLYLQSFIFLFSYVAIIIIYLSFSKIIALYLLISFLILKFIKKNKIINLFKFEGLISIPLYFLFDLSKIYMIFRNIFN